MLDSGVRKRYIDLSTVSRHPDPRRNISYQFRFPARVHLILRAQPRNRRRASRGGVLLPSDAHRRVGGANRMEDVQRRSQVEVSCEVCAEELEVDATVLCVILDSL